MQIQTLNKIRVINLKTIAMRISSYIKNKKKLNIKLNIFFAACCVAVFSLLFSCKKTEDFTPTANNAPLAVTASASSLQLNEANKDATALTLNWTTGTNNKTGASITYVLQLDKKGNNFSHAITNNIGKAVYSVNYTNGSFECIAFRKLVCTGRYSV